MALLLGRLRPGDTLPSIRDVEQQVGISRNLVRKAYLALQESGILNLRHGKGVLVQRQISYGSRDDVHLQCDKISTDILSRLRTAGISPSAFARFLYQQARVQESHYPFLVYVDATTAQAADRAASISTIWQLRVPGYSVDDFAQIPKRDLKGIGKVLTNYIRYDQVRRIVKENSDVIPLGLAFASHTIKEFSRLPENAKILLVLDKDDYPALRFLLELYRKILIHPSSDIAAVPLQSIKDLPELVRSNRFQKIIFSNRIWDGIPEELRKSPRVTRPHMEVDLASLESARIQAGVII